MNKIKQAILYGASITAILAVSSAAFAQTSSSNAGAVSSSNSASGSSSRAQSGASNNAQGQSVTFNSTTPSTTTANVNSGGGTNNRDQINYGGGTNNYSRNDGDVTVRTTPTVYAPPVSGGNPCTLAVSGGVSVIGWGAAAGGTFVDQDCANRQKIAMIHNAGYAQAAKELMCNDRDSYFAFRAAGQACAFRPAFEGNQPAPAQPIVQQAPTQLPVAAPITGPVVQPRVAGPLPSQQTLRRCRGANDQGPCFSG